MKTTEGTSAAAATAAELNLQDNNTTPGQTGKPFLHTHADLDGEVRP